MYSRLSTLGDFRKGDLLIFEKGYKSQGSKVTLLLTSDICLDPEQEGLWTARNVVDVLVTMPEGSVADVMTCRTYWPTHQDIDVLACWPVPAWNDDKEIMLIQSAGFLTVVRAGLTVYADSIMSNKSINDFRLHASDQWARWS
ncbi:hypothetical protein HN588_03420 [Candidatus Bathyarchaeota archaeon]|jgi:hypothetical protein|nr:hypothetical protein [Candidatus Bathyarchaeota archaeon]